MRVAALGLGLLLTWACDIAGPGSVGSPCDTSSDCNDGLNCDTHNGQSSCQSAHGHDTSEDATETSETQDSSEATTDPSATGPDETTGATDGDTDTDGDTETGLTLEAACTELCGCVEANCASFEQYPFESATGCMEFCTAFDVGQIGCFANFCIDVPDAGADAEHYCEHAWGDFGALEC